MQGTQHVAGELQIKIESKTHESKVSIQPIFTPLSFCENPADHSNRLESPREGDMYEKLKEGMRMGMI